MKNIHTDKRKHGTIYNIRKQINGKQYNLCYSRNLDEILPIRDYLESVNWDYNEIENMRIKWDNKLKHKNQYIYKTEHHGKTIYIIRKWVDGRLLRFGQADTVEKAREIREKCISENWKKTHYTNKNTKKYKPSKHVTYKQGIWVLQRTKNNKNHVFGRKRTYEEILDLRKRVEQANWDTSISEPLTNPRPRDSINRYIREDNGKWGIVKQINSNPKEFFCLHGFKTIEEAREERDFWESINWDFDLLDLY